MGDTKKLRRVISIFCNHQITRKIVGGEGFSDVEDAKVLELVEAQNEVLFAEEIGVILD